MTGIAVAMDLLAVGLLAGCVHLARRRDRPEDDAGHTAGMVLLAVGLGLLSVPLWSLP
ncbi:MAG TPA: hypothetical protein VIL71_02690 [Spirillospora sp.]